LLQTAHADSVEAWGPQPGPQTALVHCNAAEAFFGGARGGGKTDGVLGKWLLKERAYGRAFNALMLRRTTVSSQDAIERSRELYGPVGGTFRGDLNQWRMPNGGRMKFGYLETVADAMEWQGHNVTDVWIEEAGQYPDPMPIDRMFGVLRSAAGVPIQMVLTANPGGPGQHWIANRYKLAPFPTKPRVIDRFLPDGTKHEVAVIPSRLRDNLILMARDPGYVGRLSLVGSPQLVKAWLEGDWTAIEGAYFDCWSEAKHVVTPFAVPKDWLRFRSGDWGSFSPFSFGWWAVVQDDYSLEPGDPVGRVSRRDHSRDAAKRRRPLGTRSLPRGALVRYREWYGTADPSVAGRGLKLTAEQAAAGIIERESGETLAYGVLDPSTFNNLGGGPPIAERMNIALINKKHAAWRKADNTRVSTRDSRDRRGPMGGWDMLRQRLVGIDGVPLIYCFSTCVASIRTLPVLQHDPRRAEDLDSNSEDHCFAAGTLVETDRGAIPIENLVGTEGRVLSIGGKFERYRSARMTRRNAQLVRLNFSDGRIVLCTNYHEFLVDVDDWRYASDLAGRSVLCARSSLVQQFKSSEEFAITIAANTFSAKACACISKFVSVITDLCRKVKVITSIIWTTTDAVPANADGRLARCVAVNEAGSADVYCLTVPTTGCFAIEGGILVSNCADDWRYACMSRPWMRTPLAPEVPKDGYRPASEEIPNAEFKTM
jgi:Phage terminase large subunit